MFYIYKITNKINNKIYIGKAKNISIRYREHQRIAKSNKRCYPIHHALLKYGFDNFTIEEIFQSEDEHQAYLKEIEFISIYRTDGYALYNIANGGEGSLSGPLNRNYGKKFSAETLEKMSKVKLGKKPSEETKRKISSAKSGIPMRQETKDKLSKANKGQINPKGKDHPMWQKSPSLETRLKQSANAIRRKLSIDDIDSIKKHLQEGKLSQKDIAIIYGVNQSVISRINNNKAHCVS